ncbi:site-specific DNA-methyltransferase [Endozoicomonas gorgoniicola]|uniref:Site-specific DNA-methyltransferase n=1 Tax=Endozoicomonas gorgoniicola TaxID=1234144 RepID=A0ABT3MRZ8_9GAMM|nr:site-specific DNA-methyltransferase [Endozoicomonas gorgoniicola]MCW7552150.1 site-specific DNA-methyltransferase [Endozoicomonas gorgoniicola]
MLISQVKTDQLIPYAGNPKQHDNDQISRIAASITEFGFNVPVLIDDNCRIVSGHGRVLAAKRIGLDEVPTITLSHLDEHQKKAFMLADNRLQELGGGWNDDLLRVELSDLQAANFDIELTGFTEDDFIDNGEEDDSLAKENQCPEPDDNQPLVSQWGDVWQLGEHRLFCGDATLRDEVRDYIKEERAEMMFTDPPYGVNYISTKQDSIVGDITQSVIPVSFHVSVEHVLNENARIYMCGGCLNCPMYFSLFNLHLHKEAKIIVWVKENILMRNANYHSQYELIFFGWKGNGGGRGSGMVAGKPTTAPTSSRYTATCQKTTYTPPRNPLNCPCAASPTAVKKVTLSMTLLGVQDPH